MKLDVDVGWTKDAGLFTSHLVLIGPEYQPGGKGGHGSWSLTHLKSGLPGTDRNCKSYFFNHNNLSIRNS